jgi:hypothetical protein
MATPAGALGVKAKKVANVPLDPDDAAWADATPANVVLGPQAMQAPTGGGQVSQVEVRALHSGGEFAVRLTWKNPTTDVLVGVKHFRDAAAVMFPLSASPLPSPLMGQAGSPVLIWQWKADWEDFPASHAASLARYPDYMDYKHPTNDALNAEFGDKPKAGEKVDVLVAEGFGSITRVGDAGVEARSSRSGEFTRVAFRRTLPASAPALVPGTLSAINVAVWDGAADNRGSRKSVSLLWTDLLLEAPAPSGPTIPALNVDGPMVGLGLLLLAAGALFAGGIARADEVRRAESEREAHPAEAKAK